MALDRDATLKKAEKLLRQGKLEGAIAEYVRLIEEQPRDWATANTLGDLYARSGQTAEAAAQYSRIADHFMEDGFYPKAAALYKKILKIDPESESVQLQLADISARQGLLADAKSYLSTVANRRRKKGDLRGTAEIVVRLGDVDPADFEARLLSARTLVEMGEAQAAAAKFKGLHDDLNEKGRTAEALDALNEYVRLTPSDPDAKASLARVALEAGDFDRAREYLDRETAGQDPLLLLALAELELKSGEVDRGRELLPLVLGTRPDLRGRVIALGTSFIETNADAAFTCLDAAVDAAVGESAFPDAVAILQEYALKVPRDIGALLKLVEVCVDGGLESEMYQAQERLTDAYLEAGQPAEARAIAEDLVAREPWEQAHIDRFRRALVMLRVSDPDTLIAERLSGQAPFMAKDPFFNLAEVSAPAAAEPDPVPGGDPIPEADSVADPEPSAEPAVNASEPAADSGKPKLPPVIEFTSQTAVPASDVPAVPSTLAPPTAAKKPESGSFDEIDLTGALGAIDPPTAPPPRELAEVFDDRRSEAEGNPDYSTQHMTLARTYLEIGMVDEAIDSLKTAARGVRHRFESASTLGRLYMQRNEPAEAIEWLERAAEAPAPDADAGRSLLYDLGVLLDGAGEVPRALAVFLEIQADAGDYRDVPARIDRLARAQSGG